MKCRLNWEIRVSTSRLSGKLLAQLTTKTLLFVTFGFSALRSLISADNDMIYLLQYDEVDDDDDDSHGLSFHCSHISIARPIHICSVASVSSELEISINVYPFACLPSHPFQQEYSTLAYNGWCY